MNGAPNSPPTLLVALHLRSPCSLPNARMVLKIEANLWNDGIRGQDYQVACGKNHSAIMQTGRVLTYGRNEYGQCGVSRATTMGVVPHEATPRPVSMPNAVYLACGEEHTAVVADTGALYMMGQGEMGQLGLGSFTDLKQLGACPPKLLSSYSHLLFRHYTLCRSLMRCACRATGVLPTGCSLPVWKGEGHSGRMWQ